MRTSVLKPALVAVVLALAASCDKTLTDNTTLSRPKNAPDPAKLLEAQELNPGHGQGGMRSPITYVGQLCNGITVSESAIPGSITNSEQWDYYSFSGTAGQQITISIVRTGTCNMDPAMYLCTGVTTDSDLSGLDWFEFADDDVYTCGACYNDVLRTYTLPETGQYTIAVFDFVSCGTTLTYDITVTGIPDCVTEIIIDGCETGVIDQMVGGQLMSQWIADCAETATNHGEFVSCVSALANTWKVAGLITGAQKGAIVSCAAQSDLP